MGNQRVEAAQQAGRREADNYFPREVSGSCYQDGVNEYMYVRDSPKPQSESSSIMPQMNWKIRKGCKEMPNPVLWKIGL